MGGRDAAVEGVTIVLTLFVLADVFGSSSFPVQMPPGERRSQYAVCIVQAGYLYTPHLRSRSWKWRNPSLVTSTRPKPQFVP